MKHVAIVGITLSLQLCLSSCATPTRTLLGGAVLGGGMGFGVGLGSKPRARYSAIGAASGAAFGLLGAYLFNKEEVKRKIETRREILLDLDKKGFDLGERKKNCVVEISNE